MKKKPKTEPLDTTAPCDDGRDGGVWADPALKELAELTDKLLKVPKPELDEKLSREKAERNRRKT